MCGRYTIAKTPHDLADYFDAEFDESAGQIVLPTYNASPGQHLPTISGDSPGRFRPMLWGMKRSVEGKGGIGARLLINARSESVDSRPAFRESFRHRRCLVIADGFYEWKAMENHKQPYRIVLGSGQPFAFAGVWEETASGDRHFAILTTAADPSIRPIHDRMPVILSPSDHPLWLDTRQPDVGRFMHPDSNLALAAYAVSSAVNASRTNHPGLIEAAAEPVGRPDPSLFD